MKPEKHSYPHWETGFPGGIKLNGPDGLKRFCPENLIKKTGEAPIPPGKGFPRLG